MKHSLIALVVACIVAGCAGGTATLHSETDKYVTFTIPKSYLEKNNLDNPMKPEEFKQLSRSEQGNYLVQYLGSVFNALGQCYQDKVSMKKAIDEQSKIPDMVNKTTGDQNGTKSAN